MAKCIAVREKPPIKEIVLTLSPEEALVLKAIVGNIGGAVGSSARVYTDSIWNGLDSVLSTGIDGETLFCVGNGCLLTGIQGRLELIKSTALELE